MEKRLGRGLGSLLGNRPSGVQPSSPAHQEPIGSRSEIELDEIRPNPFQPRQVFDPNGLQELRASIQNHGILQPVVVRPSENGFELVSGERRWRAARLAGLTAIPAVVREGVSDDDMLELAMVENLQRRDLDPIERALGYQSMLDRLGLTQDEVARRVGLQRATVANHVRLLDLEDAIQVAVSASRISMGHARALLALPAGEQRLELARAIEREGLSVREVERRVKDAKVGTSDSASIETSPAPTSAPSTTNDAPPRAMEPWARGLEERIKNATGTRVEIRNRSTADGGIEGQVVLHYYDRKQLEALIERLAPDVAL
ncbi:Chromosome-partitioning protein Spo0J [Planctomycetes bacterium Pla163]|uniref:Chromosome-partitioning protein Spo0J n=1 Tax=Rohdeia mirabilis TaxID=2528008 RepID=A0A518D576_9BACT|nr:Chromosome-partitioning protein Spo0J [Planctomycetes bacterium Pla163]